MEEKKRKREEQRKAELARKAAAGGKKGPNIVVPPPDDEGCIVDKLLVEIREGTTLRPTSRGTSRRGSTRRGSTRRGSQLKSEEIQKLQNMAAKSEQASLKKLTSIEEKESKEPSGAPDQEKDKDGVKVPLASQTKETATANGISGIKPLEQVQPLQSPSGKIQENTVTSPTVTTPTVPIPTTPTVPTPIVLSPTVTTPTVTIPTVASPTVAMPTVLSPTVASPTVTMPMVASPTSTIPAVPEATVAMPAESEGKGDTVQGTPDVSKPLRAITDSSSSLVPANKQSSVDTPEEPVQQKPDTKPTTVTPITEEPVVPATDIPVVKPVSPVPPAVDSVEPSISLAGITLNESSRRNSLPLASGTNELLLPSDNEHHRSERANTLAVPSGSATVSDSSDFMDGSNPEAVNRILQRINKYKVGTGVQLASSVAMVMTPMAGIELKQQKHKRNKKRTIKRKKDRRPVSPRPVSPRPISPRPK